MLVPCSLLLVPTSYFVVIILSLSLQSISSEMSDSNPFDEPKLTSNPFEEDLNSNPEQSDLVHDTSQQQSSISYSVVSESGRGWQERWALTAEKISLSYPPFTISVSNPEVFGNMMSRYVVNRFLDLK